MFILANRGWIASSLCTVGRRAAAEYAFALRLRDAREFDIRVAVFGVRYGLASIEPKKGELFGALHSFRNINVDVRTEGFEQRVLSAELRAARMFWAAFHSMRKCSFAFALCGGKSPVFRWISPRRFEISSPRPTRLTSPASLSLTLSSTSIGPRSRRSKGVQAVQVGGERQVGTLDEVALRWGTTGRRAVAKSCRTRSTTVTVVGSEAIGRACN